MIQLVDIKVEDCCMVDRYIAHELELHRSDLCIVHTDRGMELGRVVHVFEPESTSDNGDLDGYRKVLRKANTRDLNQFEKKRQKEEHALEICLGFIRKHGLVMKLTRVEYVFDGSKVVFYYTADGRVDFRALVKDLASSLKTRIEMRQIGVRDEAKLLGGIGCCGLPLCCASWLKRFHPVSIKVAKQQCLNLNPSRLSGVCGRLMCCLMYEKNMAATSGADRSRPADRESESQEDIVAADKSTPSASTGN